LCEWRPRSVRRSIPVPPRSTATAEPDGGHVSKKSDPAHGQSTADFCNKIGQERTYGSRFRRLLPVGRVELTEIARRSLPADAGYFMRAVKCLYTGSSIFQVPLNVGSTTKASPPMTVTGVPSSGVMVILPASRCTNSNPA